MRAHAAPPLQRAARAAMRRKGRGHNCSHRRGRSQYEPARDRLVRRPLRRRRNAEHRRHAGGAGDGDPARRRRPRWRPARARGTGAAPGRRGAAGRRRRRAAAGAGAGHRRARPARRRTGGVWDGWRSARCWCCCSAASTTCAASAPSPSSPGRPLAALIAVHGGYGFHALTNPFSGGVLWLGPLGGLLTVAWIVVVTNAFNLIDGLDGLAAGTGLIAAVTLFLVALSEDRPDAAVMAVTLAGVLAGFLRFNFAPASIFLGDAGSLLLGYLLSVLSIQSLQKGPDRGGHPGADPHPRPADPRGGGDRGAALARRRHRLGVPRRPRAHPPSPARPRHDPPPRRAAAVGGVRRLRRARPAGGQRPRPRQRRDRRRRRAGDGARPAPGSATGGADAAPRPRAAPRCCSPRRW